MDVFTTSATAVSVLAALVTILSKLAAARIERRRDHTIADVKWWAASADGQTWIRGYVEEWLDDQVNREVAKQRHGGGGGSHGGGYGSGHSSSPGSGHCNTHGYLDNEEES